jgi:hypothetical protein
LKAKVAHLEGLGSGHDSVAGGSSAANSMYWETPALFNDDAVARFLKDVTAA